MAFYFIKDTTLTDIANAIREKSGTEEKLNAGNFAEEIRKIEGGNIIIPEGECIPASPVSLTLPNNLWILAFKKVENNTPDYWIFPCFLVASFKTASLESGIVGSEIYIMSTDTGQKKRNVTLEGDLEMVFNASSGVAVKITGTNGGTITIS